MHSPSHRNPRPFIPGIINGLGEPYIPVGEVEENGGRYAYCVVDFAIEAQRDPQMSAHEAIYQACLIRFRTIMMTTMAAIMGTLPLVVGLGAGSESRRPLGMAVVGGLLVSQLLTLYVTPVLYTYMESLRHRLGGRRAA
jgi:HAE1 family hydrophobic/amphiphilic exporter-1